MAALSCKWAFGACTAAIILALSAATAHAAPAAQPEIVQLSIGGGAVDSAAFRWSSALAETLSRPPGLPECDPATPCGVPGVVAGAQTYDDSKSLLSALSEGKVATAVIAATPLVRARCDVPKGETAKEQAGPAITTLKILYRQPLYLIVHGGTAPMARPVDWIGKTVVTGVAGSDSETIALALMDAYRLPKAKIKLLRLAPPAAFTAIRNGTAAVGIFIGHVFDVPVGDFISHGFTLMSLPDTPERNRLLQALPALETSAIPPGAYPGLPAISTLAQSVAWVAGPNLDGKLAERLIAATSEIHNQTRLADLVDPMTPVPEGEAFLRLPAPPSDGAKRFAASKHLPLDVIPCSSPGGR